MIYGRSGRKKSRLGSGVYRPASTPGSNGIDRSRRAPRMALGASFVVLVAVLIPKIDPTPAGIDYGFETEQYAREDVRAEFTFESVDLAKTAEAREEAAAKVWDAYRVDPEVVERQLREIQGRIEALNEYRDDVDRVMRQALLASDSRQDASQVVWQAVRQFAADRVTKPPFETLENPDALAAWLMPSADSIPRRVYRAPESEEIDAPQAVEALEAPRISPPAFAYAGPLGRAARQSLQFVLTYGILPPDARARTEPSLAQLQNRKILIYRDRPIGDIMRHREELPLIQVPTVNDAHKLLETRAAEFVAKDPEKPLGPVDSALVRQAAFEMARGGIVPTLELDTIATEAAREAARREVEPLTRIIPVNKPLIRAGDEWTEQTRTDARTYLEEKRRREGSATRLLPAVLAAGIFAALALVALDRSLTVLRSKRDTRSRDLYVSLLILCGTLVVGRIVSYFGSFGYLVPVAAGVIALAILVNARMAAVVGFLISALLSAQFDYDWQLLVVSASMSFAGALGIFVVRRRTDMAGAAVKAIVAGLLAMCAATLATDTLFTEPALHKLMLIGLNGAACLFIVPGLLPPLEKLFGITTDIQLLEYSDLNNEVLSRMAIEVPATYAHSLMLGQLAEAAADAIGANGLLARVCAYYHDIGKLRRPQYFSENQTEGNVHDTLSPRLSARAIAAHVIQGAEMAREAHLPKPIVDGILEHHGTSLISFFYQQALAQQKHGDIREEDFRYPGPKPQSRETAILMICDAVESGVRSIKNPNEERVREFVDKIIAARAADRQFDESDLTLKDLDIIAEVVSKRVLSSLHTRIAYPTLDERKNAEPDLSQRPANVVSVSGHRD